MAAAITAVTRVHGGWAEAGSRRDFRQAFSAKARPAPWTKKIAALAVQEGQDHSRQGHHRRSGPPAARVSGSFSVSSTKTRGAELFGEQLRAPPRRSRRAATAM